jgi:hypothetical protein
MAFTKYAQFETQVLNVYGSTHRVRNASLGKLADFEDYRTQDGYLYARIRAISSRVNKNHDGWPSVELAGSSEVFDKHTAAEGGFTVEANADAEFGYSTFLGKPIFVDHHNSNPERARGVIVDAKLHVEDHKTASLDPYYASDDCDPSHKPAAWVELLLEVDAKSFPKLAQAIIEGSKDAKKGIDGFSMGCDVERSVCNICTKEASSPDEYCKHIQMKGAEFKHPKTGKVVQSYENCYGIRFFEISAVFDPADETALIREVRHEARVVTDLGKKGSIDTCPHCQKTLDPNDDTIYCEHCGENITREPPFVNERADIEELPETDHPHGGRTAADAVADACPDCNGHTTEILNEDGESHCHSCGSIYKTKKKIPQDVKKDATTHLAENPAPQSDMLHAPEEIDTLRDEEVCPICGSVMDAEECEVCGYVEPPEGFDNPDLSKAKDTDLREQNGEDGKEDDAFEDIPEGQLGPVDSQPTSNPQALAHVRSDMAWETSLPSRVAATNPDRENPVLPGNRAATDEPKETVLEDPTTPVTSSVRTASEFIAAAGATRRMNMNHTADAASGAPAVATPDKNVDTTGVGGVLDASNEQASKADAQVDVLGVGGTGVESVGSDSTDSLGEASPGSDDSGFDDSKNIEAIPTKTFGDGSSGVERQADPVSSEVFEGNGKSSSWTIEATEDAPFPTDLPRVGEGQKAVQGTEPTDPVGKAQDRVDVLQSVTSPSNNSGPTTTWSGTDGNGVTKQQEPTTNETLEGSDGVKAAHLFTAFKLADLEVELGLLQKEQKYARVAELESKSSTEVTAALAYAQKVKTAGLARGGQKSASRLPVMSRDASTEDVQVKEASTEIPDEAVFM